MRMYNNCVYGYSDDLVYVEGVDNIEICTWNGKDCRASIFFKDGTHIEVKYGKNGKGVWSIVVKEKGTAKQQLDECMGDGSEEYSDVFYIDAAVAKYEVTQDT